MQHAIGASARSGARLLHRRRRAGAEVDLLHGAELGWPAVADRRWALDGASSRPRSIRQLRPVPQLPVASTGPGSTPVGSEDAHARAAPGARRDRLDRRRSPGSATLRRAARRALPPARFGHLRPVAGSVDRRLRSRARARASGRPADACPGWRAASGSARPRRSATGRRLAVAGAGPDLRERARARALIVAGGRLGDRRLIERGLRPPRLARRDPDRRRPATSRRSATTAGGRAAVRGRGTISNRSRRPTLLLAAEAAFEVSGDAGAPGDDGVGVWLVPGPQRRATAGCPAVDRRLPGRARSGRRATANQGAESTLMWLIALEHDARRPELGVVRPSDRRPRERRSVAAGVTALGAPRAVQRVRGESHPDRGRPAVPRQHRVQSRRGARRRTRSLLLARVEDRRGHLPAPRRPEHRRHRRLAVRSGAARWCPIRSAIPRRSGAARIPA